MADHPPKKDEERDPAEAARIRDEALKRAMGVGSKPTPKDGKNK